MNIYEICGTDHQIITEKQLNDDFNGLSDDEKEEYNNDFEVFLGCQDWQSGGELQWLGRTVEDLGKRFYAFYYHTGSEKVYSITELWLLFLNDSGGNNAFKDWIRWTDELIPIMVDFYW